MSVQNDFYCCAVPTKTPREQILRKPLSQNRLNATTPLGGRPRANVNTSGSGLSRSATVAHSPLHNTCKSASAGRPPALTLRIEDDMISQSIQSAPPTRAIRPLPSIPSPYNSISIPSTPFSKLFSVHSRTLTLKRTPRPLPCPPLPAKDHPQSFTTPKGSPPGAPLPIGVVRPLPTPGQRVEPLLLVPNDTLPLETSSAMNSSKVDMASSDLAQPIPSLLPSVVPALTLPSKILDKDNSSYPEGATKHDGLTVPEKNDSLQIHIIHTKDDEDKDNNALPLKPSSTLSQPFPLIPQFIVPSSLIIKDRGYKQKTVNDGLSILQGNDPSTVRVIHAVNDNGEEGGGNDDDIFLLQKRIVLASPRPRLDSDITMSDDDDSVPPSDSFPDIVLPLNISIEPPKSPDSMTLNAHSSPANDGAHTDFNLHSEDEDKEVYADYAWVLSNRILYYQNDPQHTGKWVREKNGKRYTQQDYESVLKVLRTL